MSPATAKLGPEFGAGRPPLLLVDASGDAARWAAEHRTQLVALITEHGSIFVRGLGLGDAVGAAAVFRQLGVLMPETEAFAPRRRYEENVYSASKWPPNQIMCMHHELSYGLEPPSLMQFACVVPPEGGGGATLVADSQAVLEALPAEVVGRFEETGWLLVRNYNPDIGASIADAFGTDDRQAVERYCREHAITFEWQPDGGLRTWQRRSAVVRHPVTGRRCWFNQIAFLSQWTLAEEVREYLVDEYGADALPFNTCFGNGDAVDADIVQTINAAYDKHTVREPWQAGDLLLVDNIRTAHGREPFVGSREVVVAMADPVRPAQ